MKIIAGNYEIPFIVSLGRTEYIDGIQRNILEIWSDEPLPEEVVGAMKTGWSIKDEEGNTLPQYGYNEVIRYSTWIAQMDPNLALIEQLTEDRDGAITEHLSLVDTIHSFLRVAENDALIALSEVVPEWALNAHYVAGDPVEYRGHFYRAIVEHPSLEDPNRAPDMAPALWAIYHAKSAQYAMPWVAPTHAENIYRIGEWMVWTDGKKYEAVENTDRDPETVPGSWRVEENEAPGEPIEPEEPEEPEEENSNGTAVWSVWQPWSSNLNEDLYQIGDRVTHEEERYISTVANNHYAPHIYGWELVSE